MECNAPRMGAHRPQDLHHKAHHTKQMSTEEREARESPAKYLCEVGHPYNEATKTVNTSVIEIKVTTGKGIDMKKFIPELKAILDRFIND